MKIAAVQSDLRGRGVVLALGDSIKEVKAALSPDRDGCHDDALRFWNVPDATRVGDTVGLCSPDEGRD